MQKVKNKLEISFGKKVKVEGNTAKITLKELDAAGICQLNSFNMSNFCQVEDVRIKRSGTGITVLVTVK